jgi:hypothetical protein
MSRRVFHWWGCLGLVLLGHVPESLGYVGQRWRMGNLGPSAFLGADVIMTETTDKNGYCGYRWTTKEGKNYQIRRDGYWFYFMEWRTVNYPWGTESFWAVMDNGLGEVKGRLYLDTATGKYTCGDPTYYSGWGWVNGNWASTACPENYPDSEYWYTHHHNLSMNMEGETVSTQLKTCTSKGGRSSMFLQGLPAGFNGEYRCAYDVVDVSSFGGDPLAVKGSIWQNTSNNRDMYISTAGDVMFNDGTVRIQTPNLTDGTINWDTRVRGQILGYDPNNSRWQVYDDPAFYTTNINNEVKLVVTSSAPPSVDLGQLSTNTPLAGTWGPADLVRELWSQEAAPGWWPITGGGGSASVYNAVSVTNMLSLSLTNYNNNSVTVSNDFSIVVTNSDLAPWSAVTGSLSRMERDLGWWSYLTNNPPVSSNSVSVDMGAVTGDVREIRMAVTNLGYLGAIDQKLGLIVTNFEAMGDMDTNISADLVQGWSGLTNGFTGVIESSTNEASRVISFAQGLWYSFSGGQIAVWADQPWTITFMGFSKNITIPWSYYRDKVSPFRSAAAWFVGLLTIFAAYRIISMRGA